MEKTEQKQSGGLGFYIKNIILISIFWIVCSIPLITIGASCCAMYRTVHRVLYQKENKTWTCFKMGFKEHFKPCYKMLDHHIDTGDYFLGSQPISACTELWIGFRCRNVWIYVFGDVFICVHLGDVYIFLQCEI